jgi:hypothetical protein
MVEFTGDDIYVTFESPGGKIVMRLETYLAMVEEYGSHRLAWRIWEWWTQQQQAAAKAASR